MTHPPAGPDNPPPPGGPGRDLATYEFPATGAGVRVVMRDGAAWFVAADVCAVLGISNGRDATAALDDDEKGVGSIDTLGGPQQMAVISEAGLYSLILRSRKPEAKAFKRWVTHEVIPQIRQTGTYSATPALPQTYAEALRELAASVEKWAQVERELEAIAPRAQAWDQLASAYGDLAVADAAKILSRDPSIRIGRDRLFTLMATQDWIYRSQGDGRWHPYQTAIEAGRLCEMPSSHYHPRTGELILDAPQVRVTVKGLQRLHELLGGTAPLPT